MNCASCGFDNPDGMRFCGGCGAELTRTCADCGFENPPGFSFCGRCGASLSADETPAPRPARPVLAPRSPRRPYTPKHLVDKILGRRTALEGERKLVTVLFVDIRDSLELSEQVDPEAWHGVLDRFFQILADGVHRFEGTVNQYTGDGIMALFGAPIAHEDHAQRACFAALHLRDAVREYADEVRRAGGLNFSVRMGINSGEVVVGRIGDDLRMDYTALGHTVGLAARVENAAPPERIYLAPATHTLVDGWFALSDAGAFRLKGIEDPVEISELVGTGAIQSRLDLSRARGFSRFLGRTDEIQVLDDALEETLQGGAQMVSFVAEAGVGKSRLCHEFLERCRNRGIPVTHTAGVSHGRGVPLLPILALYRQAVGVSEQDSPQAAREKIAGRALLMDPTLADELPILFEFLGVADPERPAPRLEPEARQRRIVDFDLRYTLARARHEPMVSLYEDLHWFDEASLSWVENATRHAAQTRTLVIANFRPDFTPRWEGPAFRAPRRLAPLGAESASELLDALLGHDPSLDTLKPRILRLTKGNPFFIEEVVRDLSERGCVVGHKGAYAVAGDGFEIESPSTVQAILASRIDLLPEESKSLLQAAAVVGRSTPRALLEEITDVPDGSFDAAVSLLLERELLFEESLYPEVVYAFVHPLTREVATRSQLARARARTHERVAHALERTERDRLDECAALIAHHYEEASIEFDAAAWHARAARWIQLADVAEALRHWRSARDQLMRADPDDRADALGLSIRVGLLQAGVRHGLGLDEARRLLEEGRQLALQLDRPRELAGLLVSFGSCCIFAGDHEAGVAALREAEQVAEAAGLDEVQVSAQASGAWTLMSSGRLAEALEQDERGLARFTGRDDLPAELAQSPLRAALLALRAHLLHLLGRPGEALLLCDEVDGLTGNREPDEWAISSWSLRAFIESDRGRNEVAMQYAGRALRAARARRDTNALISALGAMAHAHFAAGDLERVVTLCQQSLDESRDSGLHHAESRVLARLASALLALGDAQGALDAASRCIERSRHRERVWEAPAQVAVAHALRVLRGLDAEAEIEAALHRAHDVVEETGAARYAGELMLEEAQLSALRGDRDQAERELHMASEVLRATGRTQLADQAALDV